MSNFVFTNFFSTTLSAAVLSTATTITVSSSSNLPTLAAGQVMPIVLTSASNPSITEICYVTAIGGTTLTVERAQEGTGALAWNVGDFVSCDITAQSVAAVDGNAANPFNVGNATTNTEAVALGQLQNDTIGVSFTSGAFSQPITIPNGTASDEAINLGQLQQVFAKNGQSVTSANTTLNAANAGQIITVSGSTAQVTITLPSSNASATGNIPLVINNASSYPVVVAAPSGDNLSGGSIGTLQPNQSMFLFNDGGSTWITLANEAGSTSPVVVGNATASNQAVARGQTFLNATIYDVTASRAITTTYTNSTGKVMFVSANGVSNATSGNFYFTVGGKVVGSGVPQTASNIQLYASALVPIGATYQLNGSISSLTAWIEEY